MYPPSNSTTTAGGVRLTPMETRLVERVLKMESGYLLDFSHPSLTRFMAAYDVDFDDPKYSEVGPSKANKFRAFLRVSNPPLVAKVLGDLLEMVLSSGAGITDEHATQFRSIIARIAMDGTPSPRPAQPRVLGPFHSTMGIDPPPPEVVSAPPSPLRTSLQPTPTPTPSTAKIKLFISHAATDERIAAALLEFVEASVELPEGSIRCTSVHGYKHPTGTRTSDALREELAGASCVVGLITATSAESQWVLFELGARWGLRLPVSPVLHPASKFDDLPGALKGTQAVKLDDEHGVVQLVDDIERETGCRKRATAKILAAAKKLVEFARTLKAPAPAPAPSPAAAAPTALTPTGRPDAIHTAKMASAMWAAVEETSRPKPNEVDALNLIRRQARDSLRREGEETINFLEWDKELRLPMGTTARLIAIALEFPFSLKHHGNTTAVLVRSSDIPF